VARACEVETGACEDMVSRVSLWCDSTGLVGAQGRCRAAYGLTPCSPAAKSTHYLEHIPYSNKTHHYTVNENPIKTSE